MEIYKDLSSPASQKFQELLNEYKNEAFGLFESLLLNLKSEVTKIFSRMRFRRNVNAANNEMPPSFNKGTKKEKVSSLSCVKKL